MSQNRSAFPSPSLVVAQALDGQIIDPPGVVLEMGSNLFRGHPRPVDDAVPSTAVFVLLRGGDPIRRLNRDQAQLTSNLSVYVRGPAMRHEDGEDFARGVWLYLRRRWELTPPDGGYMDAGVNDSEPEFVGYDDLGHSQFTCNLRLWREE